MSLIMAIGAGLWMFNYLHYGWPLATGLAAYCAVRAVIYAMAGTSSQRLAAITEENVRLRGLVMVYEPVYEAVRDSPTAADFASYFRGAPQAGRRCDCPHCKGGPLTLEHVVAHHEAWVKRGDKTV